MAYRSDRAVGRRLGVPWAWWRHLLAALALLAYLAGAAGLLRGTWVRWQAARYERRGVAFGLEGLVPGAALDPWGVNVALEQHEDEAALAASLDLIAAGGFRWVRQRFPWAEIEPARGEYSWERWDRIVQQCQARGLRIVAVLDGSPAWARAPEDADNPFAPPRNPADLAIFARALATRYGAAIDHYQVWDQPNIYPHWGERDVDPEGYLRLLRAARTQVRDVDPGATLICAGLAPTTEQGGRNLSELLYLRACYDAGGGDLFDVVAVKPYGFWSGPEDRQVDPAVLNYSRLVALREEMVRHGDADKPVWAVAWGWNALPADWEGRPSPWGTDEAWKQHDRDLRAIERARQEWPWLGLMCYAAWQPLAPADDPVWGLALLDRDGKPGPLYDRLQALAREQQVLYPGYHQLAPADASPVEISFWGTRLDVVTSGRWELVEVDGRPQQRQIGSESGLAPVVRGLPLGEHRALLRAADAGAPLTAVVSREEPPWLPVRVALTQAAIAALATLALWRLLRPYPWRRCGEGALSACRGLSPWTAFAGGMAGLVLLAVAPGPAASLAALALLALFIAARPDVGLMLAVFLVPLAPLEKWFGPLRFSFLEIVTLLTLAMRLVQEAAGLAGSRGEQSLWRGAIERLRAGLRGIDALDGGFLLLVAVSLLSLTASENLRVSLRELRVVILQAAFIYWLVTRGGLGRAALLRLADLLVLSAAALSVYGLYQYAFTGQVVVAEGVRRMRGIYGSPNNLALVLGRLLPIMLAVVLRGARDRRRYAYALAAVPAVLSFFLTYSRAGWLFGLPASLVVLCILAGRRARVVALGLAAIGLVALVPLAGTARLGSLLSFRGTSLLRVKLWEAAWEMAWDHPLRGVGLDNFLYEYPRYIRPEALSEPDLSHPHNIVLDFWLRLGVPGLVTIGWLEWHFWRRGLGLWRRRADPALWALTIGLLAGMADVLAHGAVDASFFVVELAGLFALMAGFVRRMEGLQPLQPGP
ncbi:MAG: O-antigen ligase family protein [Anaerolineae bacterium]|nr:O-antigen ligase family protein [Anaerolineae bacterium]